MDSGIHFSKAMYDVSVQNWPIVLRDSGEFVHAVLYSILLLRSLPCYEPNSLGKNQQKWGSWLEGRGGGTSY